MQSDLRAVRLGSLGVTLDQRPDGSMIVRSIEPLHLEVDKLTTCLDRWAAVAPDRLFLAQRGATGDWRRVSYGDALSRVRSIARALLDRNLSPERPIAILSGNGIDHALLALAAMYIGIPYAPISPAYSLMSSDYGKLKAIIALLTPGLVYAADATTFGKAIAASCDPAMELVASSGTAADRPTLAFDDLLGRQDTAAIDAVHATVGPDTVAKILFTSGSTGHPKGVINTQRMWCANQSMLRHWLAFVADQPPVLVDWLPWSHTFGGNHNFGLVLYNGGTLYIDDGKPTPQGIGETIRNLREVAPTIYFNVPKGYEELVPWLRREPALRARFFSRLSLTFYAGASLAPRVSVDLDELAVEAVGERILMVTSLGATETAPAALACSRETARPGVVGVPLPGVELKLLPASGKLEARLKGPIIMPGYWRDGEQTRKAFDEEGFYRLGDALKFAEDLNPAAGFVFDGRVAEDFKLATGTWVSVGPLRARVISAFAPLVKDVVIAGHDRDAIAALIFPDFEECRNVLGGSACVLTNTQMLEHATLRSAFSEKLAGLSRTSTGSSTRIARLVLLEELPSIDANEMTDKGSINQRAVLSRRASLVEELYAASPSPRVIADA